ncbi:MAG: Smr/MutS family protein [Humidesulfovibrio sp.]|uniref:Smr/MutS family protein n=1 Tax=Humidesulfovibrio sp. TaxID=2910988 RepID=UPI0027F3F507|nr:Smr/MutS family protein [Humidesulfovibrio sp.]MDQ7835603.1 Smr/MutS family protein [Humidesulfovibrio sp.]
MAKKLSSLDDLKDLKLAGGKTKTTAVDLARIAMKGGAVPSPKASQAKPSARPAQPAPEQDSGPGNADDAMFFRAMQGIAPLAGSGRQIQPPPPPPAAVEPEDGDDSDAKLMRLAAQGAIEFDLELSDEYMRGFVRGLDSKIFQQLKAGSLSVEGHLDLHGQNADQAHDALLFFMRESYLAGKRVVLVIPGRGKNSPGGLSILRAEIQSWLTREPLRRIVLAFCTAQPRDGGTGALYVLLRKIRKSVGKVAWDKQMNWEDLDR